MADTGERAAGELHKTLSVTRGIGVAVSMVVGSGLLVLPGLTFTQFGDAAVFAWIAAAVVMLPLLLVFARLGAHFPNAGGVIGFLRAGFGRAGAGPIAYVLLGATAFGGAAMALTGANYVASLLGSANWALPAAAVYLIVVGVLNAQGAQLASGLQTAVTAVLVLLIALVAVVPFAAPGYEPEGAVALPSDPLALVPAIGLVFFAFTGWELVASTTEEYRNPRRDLPIVVGASFLIMIVLYVGVAAAVQVSLDPEDPLTGTAPVVAVLGRVLGGSAGVAAGLLGALIIFATLMGGTWATSRIVFATARERLLPLAAARVNPANGAPVPAILVAVLMFGGVVLGYGAGLLTLDQVFRLSSVNFLVGYILSALAYGAVFRAWWQRALAVLAALPALAVLAGFGPLLVFPAVLLAAGAVAHRVTARRAEPAG
ncbi:APC family permease [Nocardiopsis sp. CNT-189]|uniref:APC family permease n=1 Tax=Nocardiopsis oceanisediminis TaxID=2816862 RepID=UPI003B2FE560